MSTVKAWINLICIALLFIWSLLAFHIVPVVFHGVLSLFGGGDTKRQRRLQFFRAAISWDQAVNTAYWGHPDNTISGRVGYWAGIQECPVALSMEKVINVVMMEKNHCRKSVEKDEPQCRMPFFTPKKAG